MVVGVVGVGEQRVVPHVLRHGAVLGVLQAAAPQGRTAM